MKPSFKRTVLFVPVAALIGTALTGCGEEKASDFKVVKIGVVGEYNAQWETVNQNLASDNLSSTRTTPRRTGRFRIKKSI